MACSKELHLLDEPLATPVAFLPVQPCEQRMLRALTPLTTTLSASKSGCPHMFRSNECKFFGMKC